MGATTERAAIRGHLYSWAHAVELQSERVMSETTPNIDRQADIELFALALRNVLRAVRWAMIAADSARDGEQSKKLRAARAAFDAAIPDAVEVRDILEHFDDYGRGKGQHRTQGSTRIFSWGAGNAAVSVGGMYELDVVAAGEAGLRLANEALEIPACERGRLRSAKAIDLPRDPSRADGAARSRLRGRRAHAPSD